MEIEEFRKNKLIHIKMENEYIRIVFLPEIGGKMIELTNKETNRQFLLESQNSGGGYKRPFYGANFEKYDTSGFDECFPSVEMSRYPWLNTSQMEPLIIPDHGELWSLPWRYKITDKTLRLVVKGKVLAYQFEKQIQIVKNEVHFRYKLKNLDKHPFHYIWSAHPLLKVVPGAQLLLHSEISEVFLNWASNNKIGKFGDTLPWPHVHKNSGNNYSYIPEIKFGEALKCFSNALDHGCAGIYFPDTDEACIFQFDVVKNPYLGIWLCYGGWPVNRAEKQLTVALEPSSGRPDSLIKAFERNESSIIGVDEIKSWDLSISILEGLPNLG